PAMTDDTIPPFSFPAIHAKKVTAAFDGGRLTSNGGVMLLAMAERRLGLADNLARVFPDRRDPTRVVHSLVDMKEELGLDHFEGRSWQGLHRHALMTMIAYAFLQHRRLAYAGRKKKNQRASASTNHARRTPCHRRSHPSAAASAMPILPKANP
ncbi:transposase, partial [Bradyrhizobium diazoefficiens]